MARLAACSPGSGCGWVEQRRRVKGAKADRNVGRRQECLPRKNGPRHETSVRHSRGKARSRPPAQGCRRGTQDCVLHGEAGVASLAARSTGRSRGWVERRAEGGGGQGRQECRPQARMPAPQRAGPARSACGTAGEGESRKPTTGRTAGVARKTACSTERPVWQAWRRAPRGGVAVGRKGGRRVRGPRPTGMSAAGKNASPARGACGTAGEGESRKPTTGTRLPVWHARLRAPRRGRCGTQDCVLHAEAGVASLAARSTGRPARQACGLAPQRVQAGGLRCWGME